MNSPSARVSSTLGFPHSEIHGSRPVSGSPWLIAAVHVLHRLWLPRHSPYALFSLALSLRHASRILRAFALQTHEVTRRIRIVRLASRSSSGLLVPAFA